MTFKKESLRLTWIRHERINETHWGFESFDSFECWSFFDVCMSLFDVCWSLFDVCCSFLDLFWSLFDVIGLFLIFCFVPPPCSDCYTHAATHTNTDCNTHNSRAATHSHWLQHTATHRNTHTTAIQRLQHTHMFTATRTRWLQHAHTDCNTRTLTATHSHWLQHTATHHNTHATAIQRLQGCWCR